MVVGRPGRFGTTMPARPGARRACLSATRWLGMGGGVGDDHVRRPTAPIRSGGSREVTALSRITFS